MERTELGQFAKLELEPGLADATCCDVRPLSRCPICEIVQVTYDLTALTSAGESWLEMFDADYDTPIGGWSTEIAAGLQRP